MFLLNKLNQRLLLNEDLALSLMHQITTPLLLVLDRLLKV